MAGKGPLVEYRTLAGPFCQCLKAASMMHHPLVLEDKILFGRHAFSRLCLCIGESSQAAAAGVSARQALPGLDVTMLPSLEAQIQTPSLSSCYCSTLQVGFVSHANHHTHAAKSTQTPWSCSFVFPMPKLSPHILTDAIPLCPQCAGDDAQRSRSAQAASCCKMHTHAYAAHVAHRFSHSAPPCGPVPSAAL